MTIQQLTRLKVRKDPYEIEVYAEKDDFGEYLTGTFLYKTHLVVVSHNNGRWHLKIKSRTPLGQYQISQLRYTFIPDDVKMALVLDSREMNAKDNLITSLWEIKDAKDGAKE